MLNAAARLVYNGRKHVPISPLLRDLHWLRVPERIKFRLAVLLVFPDCIELHGEIPTVGRHRRLAETTIGDDSEAVRRTRLCTIGDNCSLLLLVCVSFTIIGQP